MISPILIAYLFIALFIIYIFIIYLLYLLLLLFFFCFILFYCLFFNLSHEIHLRLSILGLFYQMYLFYFIPHTCQSFCIVFSSRTLAVDLRQQTQKRQQEEEGWYRQQQLLLEAEQVRRSLIVKEEQKLADQRIRWDHIQKWTISIGWKCHNKKFFTRALIKKALKLFFYFQCSSILSIVQLLIFNYSSSFLLFSSIFPREQFIMITTQLIVFTIIEIFVVSKHCFDLIATLTFWPWLKIALFYRLAAMNREMKMKELQLLDATRRKFMAFTQQQKEAELSRLDDEIRRKVTFQLRLQYVVIFSNLTEPRSILRFTKAILSLI